MTTTRRTAIAALFCIVLPAAAAAHRETRPVGEFTQIGVSAPVEVEVSIGDTHILTLEGDAEAIARIETVVESGRLKIRTRPNERETPVSVIALTAWLRAGRCGRAGA